MFIFGYGSLINAASRELTGQTGRAFPAIAHGFKRSWGKIDGSYILSPLVVSQGAGSTNGVLIEIAEQELSEFDRREAGYYRVEIPGDCLELIEETKINQPVWIYVKDDACTPCPEQPIVQTYVDTVLAGCLTVSGEFTRHFIDNTEGWHHHFENDRHAPRYTRMAGVSDEHRSEIDRMLSGVITA